MKAGPRRIAPLVGRAHSTVYAVLRRHGLSRLRTLDRSTGVPIRYVREHPGELVHVDMKPLARVPAGGGHRLLGRSPATKHRGTGFEVVHVAIDDASRLAFAQLLPDAGGAAAARFLLEPAAFFAAQGVRIQRVMTDRAMAYRLSREFRAATQTLRVRHKITRPYRPQTTDEIVKSRRYPERGSGRKMEVDAGDPRPKRGAWGWKPRRAGCAFGA